MSNAAVFSALEQVLDDYRKRLTDISAEVFQQTPPNGGWSYSEVYAHIFDSSLLSLIPLEDCIKGIGEQRHTAFLVKVILFFGRFPPRARYKVPKRLVSRVKKITIAEAAAFIEQFSERLEGDYQLIGNASQHIKNKHPRLGYLNAAQWLRFIEIHLRHHLKQLKRIENNF